MEDNQLSGSVEYCYWIISHTPNTHWNILFFYDNLEKPKDPL